MNGQRIGPDRIELDRINLDLERARSVVESRLVRTPLLHSHPLSRRIGAPVHLKLENLQLTGSFKARGAACKLASLSPEEKARGVVACSSGNHGRAVARMARLLGADATICVPEWIDPSKLQAIRDDGAEVVLAGGTYDEAEAAAERIQEERGAVLVHPFDDPEVVAGQGTVGLEILEEMPEVATVVVPLSGGGLAGGIAYAVKEARSSIRIVAVSAERAPVMVRSLEAGHPLELPEEETLASALSGGIGLENRYTFRLVRDLVDRHVLVSEEEIEGAVAYAFKELRTVVEGGGAVGLAALLAGKLKAEEGPTVVLLSGGNLDPERLAAIVA